MHLTHKEVKRVAADLALFPGADGGKGVRLMFRAQLGTSPGTDRAFKHESSQIAPARGLHVDGAYQVFVWIFCDIIWILTT